ncbi:hypothetical protein [Halopseudomonas bauzanensis]|uniref:hypothetical protein n=1 Tax=Halopseudomonas bauzanensis TaxID=653930 RepID=UPI002557AAC6|nr:hypothetical protein [Halopseudomonas bauzanensis]
MAIKKLYQCSSCDDVHDFECDAEDCCQPEVYEVWQCVDCTTIHDEKAKADTCCSAGKVKCPACARDYSPSEIATIAIDVAGHCHTCNPIFTVEQHHEIESQHELVNNALGFSLSRGDSGSISRW